MSSLLQCQAEVVDSRAMREGHPPQSSAPAASPVSGPRWRAQRRVGVEGRVRPGDPGLQPYARLPLGGSSGPRQGWPVSSTVPWRGAKAAASPSASLSGAQWTKEPPGARRGKRSGYKEPPSAPTACSDDPKERAARPSTGRGSRGQVNSLKYKPLRAGREPTGARPVADRRPGDPAGGCGEDGRTAR